MGQVLCGDCLHPAAARSNSGAAGFQAYHAPVGVRPASSVGGQAPRVSGQKRALLIGINYEGTRAKLCGCHNDVRSMTGLLTGQYGFLQREMQILLDAPGATMPTRENIFRGIAWLVQGVAPGDCLVFHYSGHGAQQEDPSGSEEDCMDETILPVDFQTAGQIVDDELFEALCARLPSGVKLTAVMDCCHSGTGLDLPFSYDYCHGRNWIMDDNPCHSEGHVVLFSGCADRQTSADVQSIYRAPEGAMTSAFCETMRCNKALSYPQLLDGLHRHLSANGHDQRPQLTSSQMFDLNQPFDICGGIQPNQNVQVGRHFVKRKHPKNDDWLADGDPLGDMLTGVVIGDLLVGGFTGNGLLGGLFGESGGLFGESASLFGGSLFEGGEESGGFMADGGGSLSNDLGEESLLDDFGF